MIQIKHFVTHKENMVWIPLGFERHDLDKLESPVDFQMFSIKFKLSYLSVSSLFLLY